MNYNLLIGISTNQWVAIDINTGGECDRISFNGNEALEVQSEQDVEEFCAQIRNHYNIDKFSDIEFDIKIVTVSDYSELVETLFTKMKEAKSINIIDLKSILPINVLKKCVVKPGGVIDVKCMEEEFTVQVDDSLVMSYVSDKAGEEIIIEPESFSYLFKFDCNNLISDEAELKALEEKCATEVEKKQKQIDMQKKLYAELKKKYGEIETAYKQLQDEKNKMKIAEKRKIIRFTLDKMNTSKSTGFMSYHSATAYSILGTMSGLSSMGGPNINTKYVCKLLKGDGEVVKKGAHIIEITETCVISDKEICDVGRKSVIKVKEDGKIFYLVNNNHIVKDNQAVVVLSDPADTREAVMEWYKKMK